MRTEECLAALETLITGPAGHLSDLLATEAQQFQSGYSSFTKNDVFTGIARLLPNARRQVRGEDHGDAITEGVREAADRRRQPSCMLLMVQTLCLT